MDNSRMLDGPIPGENFTSDTKNYPWHRPPEHTDLDSAIEASFKKLTDEDNSVGLLTMIEMGVDIATLTDMFVTAGIGAGKWTPDFAILLAGPVSHIIYLMAKGYGLDCDLGIYDRKKPLTKSFFEAHQKINAKKAEDASDEIDLSVVKETASKAGTGMMDPSLKPSGTMPDEEEVIDDDEEELEEEVV